MPILFPFADYWWFYALFTLCALLPLFRLVAAARGIDETDPWRVAVRVLGRSPQRRIDPTARGSAR